MYTMFIGFLELLAIAGAGCASSGLAYQPKTPESLRSKQV